MTGPIKEVKTGDCSRKCEPCGWRKELGFHLCFPKTPHFVWHPTLLPSFHKHLSSKLHAGSCSPHPGSGVWGCSTGPEYRYSGNCPPDGTQGHTGNPPWLCPELGGPHPSGKPSHFPGSDKTWSRFGLWRDSKRKKGKLEKSPSP